MFRAGPKDLLRISVVDSLLSGYYNSSVVSLVISFSIDMIIVWNIVCILGWDTRSRRGLVLNSNREIIV